jgi:hypothetical protein
MLCERWRFADRRETTTQVLDVRAAMTRERFHYADGSGEDGPQELLERFKDAVACESIDAWDAALRRCERSLKDGTGVAEAWSAVLRQLRRLVDMHKDEMRAWAEESPSLGPLMQQLGDELSKMYDLDDPDLEAGQ